MGVTLMAKLGDDEAPAATRGAFALGRVLRRARISFSGDVPPLNQSISAFYGAQIDSRCNARRATDMHPLAAGYRILAFGHTGFAKYLWQDFSWATS
jgi:hypothetical protein